VDSPAREHSPPAQARVPSPCPSEANPLQLPCSRNASELYSAPLEVSEHRFTPLAFTPAGHYQLLERANIVADSEDSDDSESSVHSRRIPICAKSLFSPYLLRFHRNQQERLLDVAALLERDRFELFQATSNLLEDVAVATAEALDLDLGDIRNTVRFGLERNWAPAEQNFRRHITALGHIASESTHIGRLLHNLAKHSC